jgi:XTP/dITP diphosphohydrolase
MREVGLVTSNPHKLMEFQHGLGPLGVRVRHLDVDCDEVQADTLEEVVHFCLDQLGSQGHLDIILDDSGLFIRDLKGFPGVYSSYVFRTIGCTGILRLLEGCEDRMAEFRCCIGCELEGLGRLVVTGTSPGRVIGEERGVQGFGYDPIFVPDGSSRTFAQMDLDEKNRFSHRGAAMRVLVSEMGSMLKEV